MKSFALTLILILITVIGIFSQNKQEPLTANERTEVVNALAGQLNENYVLAETGEEMSKHIKSRLQAGEYESINDPMQFAEQLTSDLHSVLLDKHLRVHFAPERIANMRNTITPEDSMAFVQRELAQNRRDNFGFREVKILEGNVGYIDLRSFSNTEYASETAIAAMNYVSNADALIIDLRQNGGGSPSMIQLITSYLYTSEPVHLNNFYFRPADNYTQTWTLPFVPGKRRPDIDVYILTSNRTFSAAEEFSYNLRNLERATLVGETTGGGAHPGGISIVSDRFMVWMPSGRAINPVTNTNWEGTGVEPHISVDAGKALLIAHIKALEVLAENKAHDKFYSWHLQKLRADNNPVSIPASNLRSYAGQYGPRSIIFEEGKLYYQREGQARHNLIPLDTNLFAVENVPYFRIRIERENNTVSGITGLYDDGSEEFNSRN